MLLCDVITKVVEVCVSRMIGLDGSGLGSTSRDDVRYRFGRLTYTEVLARAKW